ncbi:MAG: hypothetical protein Kow0063_11670 [Anaerolineae bacterium]
MKRFLPVLIVWLALVAIWTTGCGGEPTQVAPRGEPGASQSQSAGLRELEEVNMTPLPTPEPDEAGAERMVKLAREDLSREFSLSPEEVRLVLVEAVDWPDTSLGCPQPGMMYAQVITPGFRVVLEAGGAEYEYHTDTGDQVVLCQPEGAGQGVAPPVSPSPGTRLEPLAGTEPPAGAEEVVRMATEDLAGRRGLAQEAIRLVSVEAVNWRDASLGCPQPGMMYAQVITPGFKVVLEAAGEEYEYHTDEGRFVVLCEAGKTSNAGSTGSDSAVQDGWPNQPIGGDVVISPPDRK